MKKDSCTWRQVVLSFRASRYSTGYDERGSSQFIGIRSRNGKRESGMKKPQLCLALSVSLTLMQANLLPAYSEPAAGAIWQKLSGVNASNVSSRATKPSASGAAVAPKAASKPAAPAINAGADAGHAMLFLPGRGRQFGGASSATPAAALTIHPAMSMDAVAEAQPAPAPSAAPSSAAENLVASSERTAEIPAGDDKPMLTALSSIPSAARQAVAMLAPDRLIAQADSGAVPVTPIPPVVTGTVDLEEFKPSNVIDLKISQSRTFKLKNKIVRTSISDPSIAEPVVVSENQIVLLGKAPGGATLVLWDDAGNSVAIDLRVTRDYSQLQTSLREIDPRIIVKAFSVGGSDRVILMGDVDHPESVIKAFGTANVFMDDRGMNIQAANSRLINARIGEQGGTTGAAGGQAGQLAQLASVDKYTYFPNTNNNISKAQVMTSDGGRVTSLVKIRKVPLIVLHCTFMEMNSTAARSLGMQLGLAMSGQTFSFAVGGNGGTGNRILATDPGITSTIVTGTNPLFTPPAVINRGFVNNPVTFLGTTTLTGGTLTSGLGQPVLSLPPSALLQTATLLGAPGGAAFQTGNLANLFQSLSDFNVGERTRFSVQPAIHGIITHSRARILAEPSLVTISGERASFLAGGEIPILQAAAAAGAAQQSVVFEPFGLRLNCIPVLLENGSICLQVSPEERFIAAAGGLQLPGLISIVPAFTTRKAQTMVELKPGQELFIAGLITANSGRDIVKTPILGEVPVLGALYRSKAFSKNESELVVAIRPEVILPGTPGQLKLPEEIGRVEGPRDMNMFQVEPTVLDERHYTSGRSERHQKTSPTLPEGSPIPDNQ